MSAPVTLTLDDREVRAALDRLARHADRLIEAVRIGAGVERDWLERQTADALVKLAAAVIEVNADFFVQRVLPDVIRAAQSLERISAGPTASGGTGGSPVSSARASATAR